MAIQIKRAYEAPKEDDGQRVLIDRLWPRGLAKEEARIDLWLKEIAPSPELRKWFGHDTQKWPEFRKRYRAELKENEAAVETLRGLAEGESVTLIYSARDTEHNDAVVLQEFINK